MMDATIPEDKVPPVKGPPAKLYAAELRGVAKKVDGLTGPRAKSFRAIAAKLLELANRLETL